MGRAGKSAILQRLDTLADDMKTSHDEAMVMLEEMIGFVKNTDRSEADLLDEFYDNQG